MTKDRVMKAILEDIAKEFGLTVKEVEAVFESQWDFIAETIVDLDLMDITEEEFEDVKTNFNVPALGKIFTTFKKVKHVNDKNRLAKERRRIAKDDV